MSLAPQTHLGHYEILALLGSGGMGEVYRARDTQLGREVAIKVLPDAFSKDTERLARFEREARLLASLNHPNIATLYGLEQSGEIRFLVMELVPGETLAEKVARGPVAIEEALPLFHQIAEGLEAAHEKGVIHRDLKPANVKVTPGGKPKILDFGLAKAYGEEASAQNLSESPTAARGTATGVILGTAPYMSPEQARGKAVDKRADIWAFGCCLFEALTGRQAFIGETVSDTIAAILKNEPYWERLPARTPPILRHMLRRCLQKDPNRRLHDIADARIEIGEAEHETEDSTAPATSTLSPGLKLAATALLASAITAAVVWGLMGSPPSAPRPVERFVIPLPEGTELYLADDFYGPGSMAISPDGHHLAYVVQRGALRELFLRPLEQTEAVRIEGSEGAKMPFFSPDGQWLGFYDGQLLKKVSLASRIPVVIGPALDPRGASWGEGGNIVFGTRPNAGLSGVSADGGEPEGLTVPDRERREKTHRFPQVLPGGRAILFTLGTGDIDSYDDASIAVLSLETGAYRRVLDGGAHARYSPSGHLVYARAGALLAVPFELTRLEVTGPPVAVVQGVTTLPNWALAAFDISREGSLLYAPGRERKEERQVVWVDRLGRSQPLIEKPRPFQGATFRLSPDGKWLALSIQGANNSLWLYEMARGALTRLVTGFDNFRPIWTPDSAQVTFLSTREEKPSVFRQSVNAGSPLERIGEGSPDSWSPDGTLLAYSQSHPNTGEDLWILSVEKGTSRAFLETPANESEAAFSPDGRFIAYQSDESGEYEVYVLPFPGPGGKRQVSTGGGTRPLWNPKGNELFYRNGHRMMAVDVDTSDGLTLGKPRVLFERAGADEGYDVAPDGQRFVMMDRVESTPPPRELILVQNWSEELKRLVPTN